MSLQKSLEQFLGACVKRAFLRERPLVIAIAGSVGKTSTKTAIGIALGAGEAGTGVVMSEKNYNNELGVPLTVFGADAPGRSIFRWKMLLIKAWLTRVGILKLRARMFILEMATDRPGDLAYLLDMARPHVGVLTAIGAEHTEFFGSIEGVAKEEGTVLRVLQGEDTAIVNADDSLVMEMAKASSAQRVSFGMSDSAMVRILSTAIVIDDVVPASSGLDLTLVVYGRTRTLRLTGTVGMPHAYAVAAALACCVALDTDTMLAIQRLEASFHGPLGRMRLLEGIKRSWLIDDSYNSSPLAVVSAIRDLAAFPVQEGAKRIAALGDMLELGSLSESAHAEMGKTAAEAGIDMLVLCGTLAHVAAKAAKQAGMPEDRIFVFAKSAEAGLFIQERLTQHDVVLIKGSQGVRMERITRELMAHPDRAAELTVRQSEDWLAKA